MIKLMKKKLNENLGKKSLKNIYKKDGVVGVWI